MLLGFALMAIGTLGTVAGPLPGGRAATSRPTRRPETRDPPAELRAVVESRMQRLVADLLGVDVAQLVPEVSLTDDLAADSLDLLELALVLESQFTIALPQPTIDGIRTYRDLVDAVMVSFDGGQRRERLTSRAVPVKARVVSAANRSVGLERAGELTPYVIEVIRADALRAGRGARLEVTMPASADDVDLAVVRHEFARLGRHGVDVTVHRDMGRVDSTPCPSSGGLG